MGSRLSPFWNTWYHWKALRLPWRKQFLAGRDLDGNTYWEFNDLRHNQSAAMANARPGEGIRMRRIVKYPRGTHPGAVMVSPQWHQWLRHVRQDAPTLEEQQREVVRQEQMRVLAARADARWANAKRVEGPIDAAEELLLGAQAQTQTSTTNQAPAARTVEAPGAAAPAAEPEPVHVHTQQSQQQQRSQPQTAPVDDPWKREELAQGHGALGETWQPKSWTPPTSKR
ncbi:hypothetical protein SEUCBS139899_001721 [Sporothrix eucalyptigena]|uniref:NADH dehydrogenase [ubiquinone] 1 alpha subcomplex subunit n=1 Tax=Sporothrix eucalyptigena TaxID=1812306 RepID=A0ABP0BWQ2_9PEZI